jgi:hypothetical protein
MKRGRKKRGERKRKNLMSYEIGKKRDKSI